MQRVPYWRLSAYYFTYFSFIGVFPPYFGLYLHSQSFSAWDIGVLMSQMQLMRLAGPYLWGALADRMGQRVPIVRWTSLAALLAFGAFFFVDRFASFFVAIAILGMFWAASLPLVEALTFEHLRDNAPRYSRIRVWGSIGFTVAVLGTGALLDRFGLSSLLWVGVGTLATIAFCATKLPEASVSQHVVATTPPVGHVLRQPRVLALLASCFFMVSAHGALNIFYSLFLSAHGYSNSVIGGLISLGVVAEIVVFFLMSKAMRRFSLRQILLASCAAAVIRFSVIGVGVGSLSVLVLSQLLHGLTFGANHAAAIAAINRWFPGKTRSRGQALYSSVAYGGGGLVGGLVSGLTWDSLGGSLSFVMSSVYALIGLGLVAAWINDSADGFAAQPAARPAVDVAR